MSARRIIDGARNIGRRAGLEVLRYPPPGSLEHELRRLFLGLGVDLVIDVGANNGGFGLRLRRVVRYSGRIESFEPVTSIFSELAARVSHDPGWRIHRMGLGSTDERRRINILSGSDMSTLHEVTALGRERFDRSTTVVGTEEIELRRLDSILDEIGLDRARRPFLKTDTEGHDMEVFRGAGEDLGRFAAILTEAHVLAVHEDEPKIADLIRFLDDAGFTLTGAFPVSRDRGTPAVITFDCTFVNRRHPG